VPNEKLLGKKRQFSSKTTEDKKSKTSNKKSKVEENIIKRIKKYRDVDEEDKVKQTLKEELKVKEKEAYDLWEVEKNENNSKTIEINYPKVPLPHPGQSYNPSKNDLKNLLSKVVEYNKPVELPQPQTEMAEIKQFEEDEDGEEEIDPNEKISNNPPVLATDKLTRKERNKLVLKTI